MESLNEVDGGRVRYSDLESAVAKVESNVYSVGVDIVDSFQAGIFIELAAGMTLMVL